MTSVPRLHLVGPLHVIETAVYAQVAAQAARGGCGAIHLRIHDLRGGDLLELARDVRAAIGDATLIVNDRADIAKLAVAGGVHLGERSYSVEEARQIVGADALIGRSIHDLEGAMAAEQAGADYLIAGHIFDTPSKHGQDGRGLDWLASIASSVQIPVIAIGGITIENLPQVIDVGAWGVAMGRELLLAKDVGAVASEAIRIMTNEQNGGMNV